MREVEVFASTRSFKLCAKGGNIARLMDFANLGQRARPIQISAAKSEAAIKMTIKTPPIQTLAEIIIGP